MKNNHHNLSLTEQILMALRKSPVRLIKRSVIRCAEEGFSVNPNYLEAHSLAGGDIKELVDGLIYCKRCNISASFDQIATRQILEKLRGNGTTLQDNLREFFEAGIRDLADQPLSLD